MIAVDTNILVYAHRSETLLHERALDELTRLADGTDPWVLPVFCIAEFHRVVTHPRVFAPASAISSAIDFVDALQASPSCQLALPGAEHPHRLHNVLKRADARGNLVYDAQIVALCQAVGVSEILTNDRDFTRFSEIKARFLTQGA